MVRRSYTAVVERGELLRGAFATEPYEAGWASEAVIFITALAVPAGATLTARVQISPDGLHWVDEGTTLSAIVGPVESQAIAGQVGGRVGDGDGSVVIFCRVTGFGTWLRVAGAVEGADAARALVTIALKE